MKRPLVLALLVALAALLALGLALFLRAGGPSGLEAEREAAAPEPPAPSGSFEPAPVELARPAPESLPESRSTQRAAVPRPAPAEDAPSSSPSAPCALAGRLVYASGLPAADAQLERITWFDDRGTRSAIPPRGAGEHAPVPLDGAGAFRIQPLEPGWYLLHAWSDRGVLWRNIELGEGERCTDLVLELLPAGAIHGRVQDREGAPLPERPVALMTGVEQVPDVPELETDDDGRFAFASIPVGTYQVVAGPPRGTSLGSEMLEQLLSADAAVEEGRVTEVVLAPSAHEPIRLTGRVLRAGAPIAGAQLFLLREGEKLIGSSRAAETGEDGAWSMSVAEPGLHTLFVAPDGSVSDFPSVAEPLPIPDVPALEHDVHLPAGGIEGFVHASDGAVASASLFAAREDRFLEVVLPDEDEHTRTDEDGHFTLRDLAPGVYLLHVQPLTGLHARTMRRVVVGDGDARSDFVLERSAKVVGRVLGPDGEPFAGAAVHALGPDGQPLAPVVLTGSRPDGSFECGRMPRGPLTFFARSDDAVSAESAPIRTEPGETVELELRLQPGALLVVRTLDAGGRPLPAGVRVLDGRGRDLGAGSRPAAFDALLQRGFSSATTELGPFVPGTWRVEASTPGGRRARKTVELTDPGRVELELRLE